MLLTVAWGHYLHSPGSSVSPPRDATTLFPSKEGEGSIEDPAVTCSSAGAGGFRALGVLRPVLSNVWVQGGTQGMSLSCPYGMFTVTMATRDKSGIQIMTPGGCGSGVGVLESGGGRLAPARRLRKCGPLMAKTSPENGNTAENSAFEFKEHFQLPHPGEEGVINVPI